MSLLDIQKSYKEYLMNLHISKYNKQTINQVIYIKKVDGRAVVLCLVDGLSILHAQWFYHDQIEGLGPQLYDETMTDLKDLGDRITTPIRIIEASQNSLEMFEKPPDESIQLLIQSFGDQNKQNIQKHGDKILNNIKNNFEQNYVICQWPSGNVTLERIIAIPKFVETMFMLQHLMKQDVHIVEQTVSGMFSALEDKKWSQIINNIQIKYINQNQKVKNAISKQKGLIVDCYTLTVGHNEYKKRDLVNQIVNNTINIKQKLLVICREGWYTQYFVKNVQQHGNSTIFQMYPNKYMHQQIQNGNFSVVIWQTSSDSVNYQSDMLFFQNIKFDVILLCDNNKIQVQDFSVLQADKKILITTLVQNDQQNQNILTFINRDLLQYADTQQHLISLTAFYELGYHWDLNGLSVQQVLQPEYITQKHSTSQSEEIEVKGYNIPEYKFQNINYALDMKFKQYVNQCSNQEFHNHLVLTINQLFEEKVRQRMFLDSDPIIQKILNDDKRGCGLIYDSKKQQSGKPNFQVYQAAITYFFATLLQLQWLTNQDTPQLNKSRTQILNLFLTSLIRLNKASCLIICPETVAQPLIQTIKTILGNKSYNIATELGHQQKDGCFNIIVLSENQLHCLYILAACYGKDTLPKSMELPRYVFFPCVSCRCCDVMTDAIYRVHGAQNYNLYQVCPLNSLEQHLLTYRQKFSFVLLQEQLLFYQAFDKTVDAKKLNEIDLYNQMLNFLKTNGYSGQNNLDYQVFAPEPQTIDEQVKQHLAHPQVQFVMSSHIHTDLILQAAWNDIFDIDAMKFNMKGFVAETYGRHDATLNINVQNPIYDSPGLINVEVQPSDKLSVEPGVLFNYSIQAGISFDTDTLKGKMKSLSQNDDLKLQNYMQPITLYQHFVQPNQNTLQANVNEIMQKLEISRDSATPGNQMKAFLHKANVSYDPVRAIRQCKEPGVNANKKQRQRNVFETPMLCSSTAPFREQVMVFSDFAATPPKRATICPTCFASINGNESTSSGDKCIIYGSKCDLCDAPMKEQYDLNQVELLHQYTTTQIVPMKALNPEKEFPTKAYEYITNIALNSFTYFGGQRIDSMYVTTKDVFKSKEVEIIQNILQEPEFSDKPLQTMAAILGLVKHENPTFSVQIRKNIKISDQLESRTNKWLQLYMDWIIRNGYQQSEPLNDNSIMYNNISFDRLIQFAVPYNLFDVFIGMQAMNYNIVQTTIAAQSLQQYAIKYLHHHLQQLQAQKYQDGLDYLQFMFQWYLQNPTQTASQRYGPLGQGIFFKQLLDALEIFPQLRNSSIFNGSIVANDSYLILALLSNITFLGFGFHNIKLVSSTLKLQKQAQYQPFQIMRAYRYYCRNASIHTPLYYLFQTEQSLKDFSDEYKKLNQQEQRYFIEQILKIKFNPIQVFSGPIDLTQQTQQSINKGETPIPDRKQIAYIFDSLKNRNLIKLTQSTTTTQHHQQQMQPYQQQQQLQLQTQQQQVTQIHQQSQISNSHSMVNTSQIQTPQYNTNLNTSQGQPRPHTIQQFQQFPGQYQPPLQHPVPYMQPGPMQQLVKTEMISSQMYKNMSRPQSGQLQNETLQLPQSQITQVSVQPNVFSMSVRSGPQARPPQNYASGSYQRGLFLDQVVETYQRFQKQRGNRQGTLNDITKRIMHHYSFRFYVQKQNILYIPNVKITDKPAEVYAAQLGMKLQQLQHDKVDINCRFEDYIAQLCDDYIKYKPLPGNPYKFWQLTEQKQQIVTQWANQQITLRNFKQINKCNEWVLKHNLLMDCEVLSKKLMYFTQDPVIGIDLDNDELYNNKPDRYQYEIDKIYKLPEEEQKYLYDQLGNFIMKHSKYKEILDNLAQFSFGIGSSPFEMFNQQAKAFQYDIQVIEVAIAIVHLMNLCYTSSIQFPFPILKSQDHNHFIEVYNHMICMRLMQMKIQQIEYFIWISRIHRYAKDEKDLESVKLTQEYMNSWQLQIETDIYVKDIQEKCNQEEKQALGRLIDTCQNIDQMNKMIDSVDRIFCQFIPQQYTSYYQRKQYPLPCFAINDAGMTDLREIWMISVCYKLAFMTIFGYRYSALEEHFLGKTTIPITGSTNIQQTHSMHSSAHHQSHHYSGGATLYHVTPLTPAQISEGEKHLETIRQLYNQLLNIWSRFHDYLLIFMQIDVGKVDSLGQYFTDKRTDMLSSTLDDRIQKKVQILKTAVFQQDLAALKQFPLLDIIRKDLLENPPSEIQPQSKQFKPIYDYMGISTIPDDVGYTPDQQRLTETNIRLIKAFLHEKDKVMARVPQASIQVSQIDVRLAMLKRCLRIEWELLSSPLEAAGKLEGTQRRTSQTPSTGGATLVPVTVQAAGLGAPAAALFPKDPPKTPLDLPKIPSVPLTIPSSTPAVPLSQPPPLQFNSLRPAKPLTPHNNIIKQENQQGQQYKIQFNHAPLEAKLTPLQIQMINEKPLSFYKSDQEQIILFIREVLKHSEKDLINEMKTEEQIVHFLFMVSSCQRQHTDEWGRLFSYIINIQPEPVEVSNEKAKKTHDAISQIVQSHSGVMLDGSKLFEKVNEIQASMPEKEQNELLQHIRNYVLHNLDIGYYNAFKFRDEVGKHPDSVLNQYKIGIYGALKQMQVLYGRPLNVLIEDKNLANEKKMGLCTYFFLAQNAK